MTLVIGGHGHVSIQQLGTPYWVDARTGYDNDAPENLERFVGSAPPQDRVPDAKRWIRLSATLVPHPHNTYSSKAVSISAPPSPGATLASRHLGYLPHAYVAHLGDAIPLLAEIGGGHVSVDIKVRFHRRRWDSEIFVNLAQAYLLLEAAHEFVEAVEVSGGLREPTPALGPDAHREHTSDHADLTRALELVSAYPTDPGPPVDAVLVVPHGRLGAVRRSYTVSDAHTGRVLGRVDDNQYLHMRDERDRDTTLTALGKRGLHVAAPLTPQWVAPDSPWITSAPPNIRIRPLKRALDLRPQAAPSSDDDFRIATFNARTQKLYIEDSRLVEAALVAAARIGLEVRTYGLPHTPFNLQNEVARFDLTDSRTPLPDWIHPHPLLTPVRKFAPAETFTDKEVQWQADYPGGHPELDNVVAIQEHDSPARGSLLPWATLTDQLDPCRLCGRPSLTLKGAQLTDPVAYCSSCLTDALTGLVYVRRRAAPALAALSAHEFDGAIVTEDQLETVSLPSRTVQPTWLDKALVLRMGIRRDRLPWTLLLIDSGLAPAGIRTSRGTTLNATDGHLCLSMAERRVCDFLHTRDLAHTREPLYPQHQLLNPSGRRRADWQLSDGTLVEYWGLPNDPVYARKMLEKRELARTSDQPLLELTEADLPYLADRFAPWLGDHPAWVTARSKPELTGDGEPARCCHDRHRDHHQRGRHLPEPSARPKPAALDPTGGCPP